MTPRAEAVSWRWHTAAFAGYTVVALLFIDHGKSLTREIAGQGSDPYIIIWFLAWWPWAITHHLSLFFTPLVWQPAGVYLGWVTSVPLLALAGWPLTQISPILTFNCFILAAPVLAAFTAYLLCLHLARGRAPNGQAAAAAIIGGFLFGYSSYEMGQETCHLNLAFTMFVPALLLIVLLRLDDRLNRPQAVLLAALALLCQFLISIEIFGMSMLFGGIAWALALSYLPARRPVLRRLVIDGLLTAPLVVIPLLPILVSMLRHADTLNLPALWPYYFTADLLNFVIPARTNLFGGKLFGFISNSFNGGPEEQDAYLGPPLLVLILLFAREQRAQPASRLLLVMFLLLTMLSLGPRLWIAGHYTNIPLPWILFVHLPLLKSALPARFALFTSLCCAMTAALWVVSAEPRHVGLDAKVSKARGLTSYVSNPTSWRLALGGLACLALLPSLHGWTPSPSAAFFRPGRVQAVLGANARLLVLPFAIHGPASFWQAENQFGFLQTGGYLGFPPRSMQSYPAALELFGGVEARRLTVDLSAFCAATHTQFIVIGPGTPQSLQADIAGLHWPGEKVDDVVIYAVPAQPRPRAG